MTNPKNTVYSIKRAIGRPWEEAKEEQKYVPYTLVNCNGYPKVDIKRDMRIEFRNREYTIEYLNNINGEYTELEIQAKEVSHDG